MLEYLIRVVIRTQSVTVVIFLKILLVKWDTYYDLKVVKKKCFDLYPKLYEASDTRNIVVIEHWSQSNVIMWELERNETWI